MPWIRDIPYGKADPPLRMLYDRYRNPDGTLDNIVTLHGLWPESLKAHFALYTTALHSRGPLPRAEREMVGLVVSAQNRCRYWVVHHARSYRRAGGNAEWVDALQKDYRTLPLTPRHLAMLDYAAKLTAAPWKMRREDVESLRDAGMTDPEILDLVMTVGYFAFANRLADGLGIELEGV